MTASRRRLTIVTHEYYPILCGGTILAHKLATEFAALGQDVEVWTCAVGRRQPRVEMRDGITVRRFPTGRFSVHEARLWEHALFVVLGLPQMIWAQRRHPADAVLSIFAIPSGLIGTMLSKVFRISSFVYVDAADLPGIESAMKRLIRYVAFIIRYVGRNATGVVITTGLEELAAPYITNSHTIVIPNGTEIPARQSQPGQGDKPVQFLSVGRLVARKGFLDVVEAFARVRQVRDDFRLTIVGSGPMEAEIRAAIGRHGLRDRVRMAGRVEYDQLLDHYLGADCYVFYGGREGSSLALIEALGYGLPLIATDEPGNRVYIEEGRNGRLVAEGQPELLADAVLNVLEEPRTLAAWGARSRELAQRFTWPEVARSYLTFFDETLGDSAGGAAEIGRRPDASA